MSPTLLVLGAGALAAPALRWAREAGLTTVVVDPDPQARSRRLAHEFHAIRRVDADAHVALARRLAQSGELAGVHLTEPSWLGLAAELAPATGGTLPPQRAFASAFEPARSRELWTESGLAVQAEEASRGLHEVSAFFRDGVFVPAGIADRRPLLYGGGITEYRAQPTELESGEARAAYLLGERAARALCIETGPVQVTLARGESAFALVALAPAFADVIGSTHVARIVHGKSPLQAWFAHLAGAGGPFDELDLAPRSAAGWIPLLSTSTGLFAGVDGVLRARTLPGVVDVWTEEPGREISSLTDASASCGFLWAEASDRIELEQRLRAARETLEVCVACRQPA